jgi:hypothetical protein
MPMKDRTSRVIQVVLSLILLFLVTSGSSVSSAQNLILETKTFKYEIASDGRNLHFIDKKSGEDYYKSSSNSLSSWVKAEGKQWNISSLRRQKDKLKMEFGNSGITAEVKLTTSNDRITFEVVDVKGAAESLTFLNLPLRLNANPIEPFAVCALSLNLFTNVSQLPPMQNHPNASCSKQFGMIGAKVTLLGVEQKALLPAIRSIVENTKDIPFSDQGGAWAQLRKAGHGSYLMNFGTLTEETVDDWIKACNNLGFNQIDLHGGSDFFRFGDLELNKKKWPEGWTSFKRINAKLQAAGILPLLHTYAFFLDKGSVYVTPVPNEGLAYNGTFTLAKPIGSSDSVITVNESTANISTITGFFVRNSVTLRIGTELISFTGVTTTAPYQFTGCKRGANGTTAGAHSETAKAYHLKECFGLFVPDPESQLFKDVAKRTADVVTENGFDGIYFDAIDGSDILGGGENAWYYGTKFVFEVAKNLKRPVGMEMSSMSHHYWHYRSRWQAWDKPVRGHKRFIDFHLAQIKSSGVPEDAKLGQLEIIQKYTAAKYGPLLLPLHLGWWENKPWSPPQIERTLPDDIEYLGCKMIGNDAGLSMLRGADQKALDENPLFKRLAGIIKQYEGLRQQHYFSEEVKDMLRQPGKEYTLFQEPDKSWNFKPASYQKHKVSGNDKATQQWGVSNEFTPQPVKLRIEALMSLKPYGDSSAVLLTDFQENTSMQKEAIAGIDGVLTPSAERTPGGETSIKFSAINKGTAPRNGSWIKMEKQFETLLNLKKNQGIGVWVKGDGSGQLLNVNVLGVPNLSYGARGDHYIPINFTGWKYFELVETESSESSKYTWPFSGDHYAAFFHSLTFGSVEKFQVWFNNLPKDFPVECLIGPVKALPIVSGIVINPTLTIGGKRLTFPVEMESGMFIEFNSLSDCKLYGSKGEFIKDIQPTGEVPTLESGKNDINFECNGAYATVPRAQVTIISHGKPLDKTLVQRK